MSETRRFLIYTARNVALLLAFVASPFVVAMIFDMVGWLSGAVGTPLTNRTLSAAAELASSDISSKLLGLAFVLVTLPAAFKVVGPDRE